MSSPAYRAGPGMGEAGILGRIRILVREVLNVGTSPTKTAASLAIGLAVGLSPLLGLHTLIVIGVAFLFGLNRVAAILASCIFNPWTAAPIVLLQLRVGATVLGRTQDLPVTDVGDDLGPLLERLAPYLLDYVVGASLVAVAVGGAAFPLLLVSIRRFRRRRGAG